MAYKSKSPLPIVEGGSNVSSYTNTDGVAYFDGTQLTTTTVGSATQVLTSNGPGNAPSFQAVSGGILPTMAVTSTPFTLTSNTVFLLQISNATVTLPTSPAVGDVIIIVDGGNGVQPWLIAQPDGAEIGFPNGNTTRGVTGTTSASMRNDTISLICVFSDLITPQTQWITTSFSPDLVFA